MMQPYHGVVIATKPTVVPAPLKRAASVARPKTAAALPAVASAVVAFAGVPDSDRQRILAMGGSTLVAERICQKYGDDPAYLRCQLDFVEARIRSITSAPPTGPCSPGAARLQQEHARGGAAFRHGGGTGAGGARLRLAGEGKGQPGSQGQGARL